MLVKLVGREDNGGGFFRDTGDNVNNTENVYWPAPAGSGPVEATVTLPGSKSQTSRALVIGTIAAKPTVIAGALASRDSVLAARAVKQFGAKFEFAEDANQLTITPPKKLRGGFTLDCGLAGTVMRFGSALAAFADEKVLVTGDQAAMARPLGPLMDALTQLGAKVRYQGNPGYLPLTIKGRPKRARALAEKESLAVGVDTTSSSQYLSALLLASPLFPAPTTLRAQGRLPSWPYVAMSLDMLADQGVHIERLSSSTWFTQPKRPAGNPIKIEPDLSNAGPFLASALLLGGSVTIKDWPATTDQVGKYWVELLPRFGASVALSSAGLTVTAPEGLTWPGQDFDLGPAGELAPTVAALCAFATGPSTLLGIGHLRGHETDRLEALATELRRLGAKAKVLRDGLRITPGPMKGARLDSYHDHRMATFGAIIGLRVPGCEVANVETTDKTLPNFPAMWEALLQGAPSPNPPWLSEVL